jgi:DNA uptake protein ComE-like DNA-binding protein
MWTERIHRRRTRAGLDRRAGVALLTALALLMLFSILGTAYIRYMTIENERTDYELRAVRAEQAASGGVYGAIGEVQAALAAGKSPAGTYDFDIPVYGASRQAEKGYMTFEESRRCAARVTVSDESGKINLNHAPASLLQQVLGIDEAAAARIVESRPRADGAEFDPGLIAGGMPVWLFSVDDMIARGLLDVDTARKTDWNQVTFYTVRDHAKAAGYLNVNAAPESVLRLVLGVDEKTAKTVAQARPFSDLAGVSAAAGKDPSGFALPAEALTFAPRCFRFESEGRYANLGPELQEYRVSRRCVRAVAMLDGKERPVLTWWRESMGSLDDTGEPFAGEAVGAR